MQIVAITQARLSSSRLPQKVLKKIGKETALELHLKRIKKSRLISKVVLAVSSDDGIEVLEPIANQNDSVFFKGSTNDVLDRFYQAAKENNADLVVRLTSDCPLIDPKMLDDMLTVFLKNTADFMSSNFTAKLPDGFDIEIMSFAALQKAWQEAKLQSDREHVTPYIIRNSDLKNGRLFKAISFDFENDDSDLRVTLDYQEDLDLLNHLVKQVGPSVGKEEYINYLRKHPEIVKINQSATNKGGIQYMNAKEMGLRYITNFKNSDKHRQVIHDLIPGGAHTYTKGDDQFPALSPAAITHGKGTKVWDLDGNEFLDCSMGLTSISLGHAYEPVLERVREELLRGVNFQRPSILEREIAERFLEMIPCHQMIKFAKNGSTATTAAVKISRAYTNRKLVAFPKDHPFYSYDDWFIGSTFANRGVPDEIRSLAVTYESDNFESLKKLFDQYPNQIACVISEPEKPHGLPEGYLDKAIKFVQSQGALYILDEMITGYKTDFPGSITKYGVSPDMATWGKGIANGFSFCALTGKKDIMELGGIRRVGEEKLFLISTTHGGETTSIAAALATINEFKKHNVLKHNQAIGQYMTDEVRSVLNKTGLHKQIDFQAAPWMQVYTFKDQLGTVSMGLKTLMQQEMIKYGVLFQGAFVPCYSHTKEDVDYFARAFKLSCDTYAKALDDGFEKFLVGPVTKPVFRKII